MGSVDERRAGMALPTSREACQARDAEDPLAARRDELVVPPGRLYFAGHSLGAAPRAAEARVAEALADWQAEGVGAWNSGRWIDLPERLGERLGRLLGARAGETVVGDSTTVALGQVVGAALAGRAGRRRMLMEAATFPTDLYAVAGVGAAFGCELVRVAGEELAARVDSTVALVVASHVDYRSGALLDLPGLTAAAAGVGARVVCDLSHSVGVVPLELDRWRVDFAVGCTYKYLHGGPGAPAFTYVAARHAECRPLVPGWLGHAAPFAFEPVWRPRRGAARFRVGTPPVLSMAALAAGLDLTPPEEAEVRRAKSRGLGQLLLDRAAGLDPRLEVASPRDPALRGSQVSFLHPEAYRVSAALGRRGVVVDYREPDLLRFGISPLSLRWVDVWDATGHLAAVLAAREWDDPALEERPAVT